MSPHSPRKLRDRLREYFAAHPALTNNTAVAWLGHRLHDAELWHFGRRAVANGLSAGMFIAFLPLPGQMLLAILAAFVLRVNLPLAVAATWLTNPFTFPAIAWFAYIVGAWCTGQTGEPPTISLDTGLGGLLDLLGHVGKPFLIGSLVCAVSAAVIANLLVRGGWRLYLWQRMRVRVARGRRD
jgi:uncharacterized protein